jgi:putative transposase
MIFAVLHGLIAFALDVLATVGVAADEKDLEIVLLRQQLRILERKSQGKKRLAPPERLMLVVLADKLRGKGHAVHDRLRACLVLVQPETVLKWHRELVRRKWTFGQPSKGGRARLGGELEALIVRLARENPRLGYDKIHGELLKLGYTLDPSTVRHVMHRHHLPPAPQRGRSSWRTFLKHYRAQMLSCDFFTIETVTLQTVYVLFFIELGTRRVHLAGCTRTPDSAWVTQQARQLVWELVDNAQPMRFLIHDRDTKFSSSFDQVFEAKGIEIVLTPFHSPKANAFAERWVRSAREECFDHVLILGQRHLRRILVEYVQYYNTARPHQGLAQRPPLPFAPRQTGPVACRDVLGGIIHDYYRQAA